MTSSTNTNTKSSPAELHPPQDSSEMSQQKRTLLFSFLIITGYMLIETIGGVLTNSLALLSDAGHMLSDAVALGATLLAFRIGQRQANKNKSFGYKRLEILVACSNGVALVIIGIMICIEAIGRFTAPPEVASKSMLIIATIGLLVNLFVAWLLHRGGSSHGHEHSHVNEHSHKHGDADVHKHNQDDIAINSNHHSQTKPKATKNLNMYSAYLHVLGDILGSIGAILAAIAMMWKDWWWADPIASLLVAIFIVFTGFRVIRESAHILMEGTPKDVSIEQVLHAITSAKGVIDVHDLHIWSITSGLHTLSCHAIVNTDMKISEASKLISDIEALLYALNIHHVTIQLESLEHPHNSDNAEVCVF